MKKLSTISLFIFGVVVTAILTASLIYYQNNKGVAQVSNSSQISSLVQNTLNKLKSSGVILNMTEISKHNNANDCWMLINNKVYEITSYFGKHPGGSRTMASTCGTDATAAYSTKDPSAQSSSSRIAHSSNAQNLLSEYYLGDFNQTVK